MHPAKSVILFTTTSGAGYGLIVVAFLFDLLGLFPREPVAGIAVFAIALFLIVVGLLASTLHLGHPERAWRALSQWRSSWLSREGVVALWTFLPILAWAGLRLANPEGPPGVAERAAGAVAALSALATLYCTGMIYASLKAVPDWATRLTPASYLILGPATAGILFHAIAHWAGFAETKIVGEYIPPILLAGMVVKMAYWRRKDRREKIHTAESATGLARNADGTPDEDASVQMLEPPHGAPNYLMQEMGFRIARRHAARLKRTALLWTFLFPILAIWFAGHTGGLQKDFLVAVSLVTACVGIVAERYLFFAEAKHVQSLYYGEKQV